MTRRSSSGWPALEVTGVITNDPRLFASIRHSAAL